MVAPYLYTFLWKSQFKRLDLKINKVKSLLSPDDWLFYALSNDNGTEIKSNFSMKNYFKLKMCLFFAQNARKKVFFRYFVEIWPKLIVIFDEESESFFQMSNKVGQNVSTILDLWPKIFQKLHGVTLYQ